MTPTVTIIFPTHNGWADTRRCLVSIGKLRYPPDKIQVILVDNASQDQTVAKVRSGYPSVTVIPLAANLGFGRAVNRGARQAKGKFLLITNNDVVFTPRYLITLVSYLTRHSRIGAAGGKVLYPGSPARIAFGGARFNWYTGLLELGRTPDAISTTDWVPGCNLLIWRGLFRRLGGFDEQFYFYFEDLDLCRRVKEAGYEVLYLPEAVMRHNEGSSVGRLPPTTKSGYYYEGKTRLLYKHASRWQRYSCLLFQFALGLPYHLVVLKHNNYRAAIRAQWKNMLAFKKL